MASLYFVTVPPYHECPKDSTIDCIINTVPEPVPLFMRQMAIWRGLKSFGARDFSPENSSDEGLKSPAPTKTAARQPPIWRNILWDEDDELYQPVILHANTLFLAMQRGGAVVE
jgi:hypothetical protein